MADTNFWIALTLSKHVFHQSARAWFDGQSRASVLFCRATQQSFLRLLTTEAVLRPYEIPPMINAEAWKVYDGLVSDRRVVWIGEADSNALELRWRSLAAGAAASPKLWMDAYLAAFAMTGEHRLVTTDKGFKRFEGLDVIVLASSSV